MEKPSIHAYVRPDLKRFVAQMAAFEDRTVSEMAGLLLAEAVGSRRRRGLAPYLSERGDRT